MQVEITGVESLTKEVEEFLPRIDAAVTKGLNSVASDWRARLSQRVQTDVYDAYTPKSYGRTGEMANTANMDTSVKGNALVMDYRFPTESDTPYYADSDDVIRAVQDKVYLWNVGRRKIPARRFWDNFVNTEFNDGATEQSLVAGINQADRELGCQPTRESIVLDGEDSADLVGAPVGEVVRGD